MWLRANAGDNGEQMTRLRRNLRRAREEELTERQREMGGLYYDQGMTMPQIAERLGVRRPTVSRTPRRAKEITESMKQRASYAIAGMIPDEELSAQNIIASPLDKRVADVVAKAVADVAVAEGIARI